MCNARNHPPGCNCGWGGGWHSGGYGSSGGHSSFSFRELNASKMLSSISYSSTPAPVASTPRKNMNTNVLSGPWTEPNASCPVCGQGVYFCQTENGGRVYFDELGPPWPKHVCTDNVENRTAAYSGGNRWDRQGWQSLQNFNVTITGRNEGFLVRVHGEDEHRKERKFFAQIADDVQFDIFRFLPSEVTTLSEPMGARWENFQYYPVSEAKSTTVVGDYLSILAHNKRGEFLVYEGFAGPGKIYDLRIKDFSESIDSENGSIYSEYLSEFFKDWNSQKPWSAISNLKINSVSGNLYKISGNTNAGDVVFQIRMDEFYLVRYARFEIFGVNSAVVSLVVEKSEDSDNFYILEGSASLGKSFPPGKKLEIKEVLSKNKKDSTPTHLDSIAVHENIQVDILDRVKSIDLEINELLAKIATLNQEKTKLIEKLVSQNSVLD
jgi:hypothetical protein